MALINIFRPKYIFCLKSVKFFPHRNYSKILSNFSRQIFHNQTFKHPPCTFLIRESLPCSVACTRYMAGHSKWQNIKHIKAAKDREKSITCSKYVRLIQFAVRESGSDPKTNSKLASLLEEARKKNIAKETLENAMKKGSSKNLKFGTLEILGPGGCMIIVEYEAANESLARHEMKYICKKYSANILSGGGRWRAVYEKKGIITAVKELNGEVLNEGKALDSAIEAGAEEVQMKENEEGQNFLEFVCSPDDINQVKKELEKLYEVQENYIAYIPITSVQINDEDMNLVDGFLEEMGNLSDVIRIYENVQ
ncbi:probable transcriptional regulatory protein Tlet_1011 [Parasteatoda tepidariorum]|uniref:probable transcriptional regulatory protein Tlet_1011 n=1 Tax=Parasteatoda tepidariorum TaxID=114398 RepID=UPI001C719B0D|nr:translational activator of cytochrome c oxidase 1 [Parasteatoda tepidariorum]